MSNFQRPTTIYALVIESLPGLSYNKSLWGSERVSRRKWIGSQDTSQRYGLAQYAIPHSKVAAKGDWGVGDRIANGGSPDWRAGKGALTINTQVIIPCDDLSAGGNAGRGGGDDDGAPHGALSSPPENFKQSPQRYIPSMPLDWLDNRATGDAAAARMEADPSCKGSDCPI